MTKKCIYFTGIGGTGMAAAAGLIKEMGYKVVGSDNELYPPMSTLLKELKIKVHTPYSQDNIIKEKPDQIVIANALSRGNVELEYALANNFDYTSFPALLGKLILQHNKSIVVTGTHGKTTTSSLAAHVLTQLKEDPGFLVGGIPKNFPRSFQQNSGDLFVIEGDEYDTAFFDKGPKFLHYCPKYLIINNIEFDHADIYETLKAIRQRFEQLINLVEDPSKIIVNAGDNNVMTSIKNCTLEKKVHLVSIDSKLKNSHVFLNKIDVQSEEGEKIWHSRFRTRLFPEIEIQTTMSGYHNQLNIAHVLGLIDVLAQSKDIKTPSLQAVQKAIASFKGVMRRFDHLAAVKGVDIYDDFAHHPTAVTKVLEGFRKSFGNRRLHLAFEPKNATSRRRIFLEDYARAFLKADRTYLGPCLSDERVADTARMDTEKLVRAVGKGARAFKSNEDLLSALVEDVEKGDAIIFMSSGSFSGIQYEVADLLKEKLGA